MRQRERREFLIVGAGPAGLAAALEASRVGVDTCVVDLRPNVTASKHVLRAGVEIRTGTAAWGIWGRTVATCASGQGALRIQANYLLLATGARARPVVFPGWQLPGVTTLDDIVGRVLVAGSGPGLARRAVALHRRGANLQAVIQTSSVAPDPADAAYLRRQHVPVRKRHMPVRAEGAARVERAVIAGIDSDWRALPGSELTMQVDTVVLDYGQVPCSELSRLSGCTHARCGPDSLVPVHDEWMRTDVAGVLVAGDVCGVSGPGVATDQGRLAGISVALGLGRLTQDGAERLARPIRKRLLLLHNATSHFPGPGMFELAHPDTVVCHCENVTAREIQAAVLDSSPDPAPVRGETRAGMGICQARDCARQIEALVAQAAGISLTSIQPLSVRPPIVPIPLGAIADAASSTSG